MNSVHLVHCKATRGCRAHRSIDRITDKSHISGQSRTADERSKPGNRETDLVMCKRSLAVLAETGSHSPATTSVSCALPEAGP